MTVFFLIVFIIATGYFVYRSFRLSGELYAERSQNQALLERYESLIQKEVLDGIPPEPETPEISEDEAFQELIDVLKENGYEIAFTIKPETETPGQPDVETPEPEKNDTEQPPEPASDVSQKEKKPARKSKRRNGKK